MDPKYRHEWKHVLNTGDLLILRQRLRAVMESDPHAIDGKYYIRSLYFDNPMTKPCGKRSTVSICGKNSESGSITAILL